MALDLVNALHQLDPTNDDHWTSDGSPMLAAVAGFLGKSTTRAEILAVAKDFNRSNTTTVVNTITRPPGTLESADVQEGDIEGEITARKAVIKAEEDLNEAVKNHSNAVKLLDKYISANAVVNSSTFAQEVQRFQKSQAKIREEAVASAKRLDAFVKDASKTKAE